jgi:hypothetical protein
MSVSSVDRPVSALRQRMLDDMAMRGLRSDTQHDYIRVVRSFAAFLGRSPDTAQAEDIRPVSGAPAREWRTATHDQLLGLGCAFSSPSHSTGQTCRAAWSWHATRSSCQRC